MRHVKVRVPTALLAVGLGAALAAQQTPVFRAVTDRVRVDVVVTDSQDRPIADLTRDDFEIVENGRLQTITDFRLMTVPVANRVVQAAAPPQPVNVATNAPRSDVSRLWAIVVDDLHLIEADIVPVKRVLTDFVLALPPEDEVALVYAGRSNLSVNFTSDLGRLLRAIDGVRGAVGFGLDALPQASGVDMRHVVRQAEQTAETIRRVASSLAGSAHPRRALVYIGTMPILDFEEKGGRTYIEVWLEPAFEQARRSNVPIYSIDPRGMVQPQDAVRGGISAIPDERTRRRIAENIRFQQHYLSMLAINTGGRAFINQSNLTKAVHEIVSENGSFYELAYAPDPPPRDGRFHRFDVRVKRPGARVRARYGYVAPGAHVDAPEPAELVETAMAAGVNVSGLTLRAVATPLSTNADGVQAAITVELTYPLQRDGQTRIDDTLALSIYALDADARVEARSTRQLRFAGTAPPRASVPLLLDDVLDLPSEALTLRVGVASRQLGLAGTVQLPFEALRPSDEALQLSGIALGVAGTSPPALNSAALAPLVPFQPTTARAFAPGDTLRVFGRVFWRGTAAPELRIGLRSSPASSTQPTLTPAPAARNRHQAVFDVTLALAGAARGADAIEVVARTPDGRAASRLVPITIGSAPAHILHLLRRGSLRP
jgi:VWFA-related protein